MATINVASSQNLSAVTYAQDDIINVQDGVTLTINSQWSIKPRLIQALGTGRIEVSNTSTSVAHLQEFFMGAGGNSGGISVTQNGVFQVRGAWITVGTSTGTNNETLFSANSVGGVALDYPTHIEVETGSGTNIWEVWNAVPLEVASGLVNTQGFNGANITAGTVAVSAAGVVTGTGTNFIATMVGTPFKLPGIARDFIINVVTSTTQITIQELDASTYTGGVIAAGSTYLIRSGSLVNATVVGSGDIGKVLLYNPVTTAVTHGDGTNGTKVPTGARVRVPNIHFNSAIQQTTLAAAITSTAAQAITLAAAIGSTAAGGSATGYVGTLLLVNGSTIERIAYTTRSGVTVSATGMFRGVAGTTAQASFPIGTTVYWIPATNGTTNNASFNTNVSGTVDMQICSAGLRMQTLFTNFASATVKNFGCSFFSLTNSSGAYDIDTISGFGNYQVPGAGGIGANFGSIIGTGSIRNIHANGNYALVSSGGGMSLVNVQDAQVISNLRARLFYRISSVSANFRAILFQTVTCATPIDGVYFNMSFQATTLTNQDIKNIYFSSTTSTASVGTADGAFPVYVQSSVNCIFRGIQLWSGGLATRNLITVDTASADNVFHNKGYPAIDGGLQLGGITADAGLNTITAFFSITNPRTSATASYLRNDTTTNSGGLFRMLLIDSIVTTTTSTGGAAKGGVEIDMIAGPHRLFASGTATSIVPNLVDVQPIVVLTNLAKTTGSVYVGSFSGQNAFNMYTFSGGTYLDNLGRIYYPTTGDSIIVKSAFALKGVTDFTGTAFDFNYNLGSGTNPIPAGTTLEFRMTNWGTANTGAWVAFTDNSSLETARAALTGYSSSVGLDLQLRITATTTVAGRYLMSMKLPVTIDAAYNPPVSETQIGFTGAQIGTLIAGYINTDPGSPSLRSSLTLTGTSGSVPMPYDYDAVAVAYRLVGRLAGWTFSNLTGTYLKEDISVPITQTRVNDLSGNALYTSGVTGVAVNYGASTITLSASRSAVQVWSAVQDNLCLLANLTRPDPFTTTNGLSFVSTYTLVVTGTLSAGNVIGNVTLSGSLSSGVVITGNVAQATPTNLTGVIINGNLTYNTNTPITVTLNNCDVTGTISNSGSGLVKVVKAGTTPWLNAGSNVNNVATVAITTPGGLALSTYILKNGSTDLGWVAQDTDRALEIQETDTFQIYAVAYGYKAALISANALDLGTFQFDLIPEPFIDTSLSTATRNLIASKFSTALDAFGRIALSLDTDLRYYTPDEVMNAIEWYIVTEGDLIAAGVVYAGSINGVSIINGGIEITTPGFYGKVNDSVTTTTPLGILVPIYIDVDPAVYVADPTYTPVQKNSSNIILQTAPWTQMTADISTVDKTDIRRGLATEDNVTAVRAKTDAYLDVAVSSRLSTATFIASGGTSGGAPTAAQNAAAVRVELATELARVDVTTSSRLAASGYTPPSVAPTAAQNASAVRTELTTELGRIDATTSSRLAASGYTSPDNASIAAIKVTTDLNLDVQVSSRLASSGYTAPTAAPTSAQNASAVRSELATELARIDDTISSRLAASGYTASGAPTAAQNATAVRTELATELARIDTSVASRLAASGYTAPDNASITTIKQNTGLIPALL
jgi:hypothetical protein